MLRDALKRINGRMLGRCHEFEGGGSMHWKVGGGLYSKNTKIWKRWGVHDPQLLWWCRLWCQRPNVVELYGFVIFEQWMYTLCYISSCQVTPELHISSELWAALLHNYLSCNIPWKQAVRVSIHNELGLLRPSDIFTPSLRGVKTPQMGNDTPPPQNSVFLMFKECKFN